MSRHPAVLVAIPVTIVLFAFAFRSDPAGESVRDLPVTSAPPRSTLADEPEAPRPISATDVLEPRPWAESLSGTTEDGALVVDEEGRFVPSPDAIDLFDYYLSALGERTEDEIRLHIASLIRERLDVRAAGAALGLLDDYFRYRARAAEWFEERRSGESLERRLQTLRELRREIFGPEVARALFRHEEARWFVELERRRVTTDPSLDPDEREERLEALESELPPEILEARRQSSAHIRLRREEDRLRSEGATDDEIARLREERFGDETAERLAILDQARARWQTRLREYRAARQRILSEEPEDERPARIEDLRARLFDARERIRVRALDRIESGSGT
ncbi:MAG TPA: hypothetical protein ENI85_17110 [Deltaproteobacteria bacterium]|nr:hypothetical protein [Deltaproteobacteria bacterium]